MAADREAHCVRRGRTGELVKQTRRPTTSPYLSTDTSEGVGVSVGKRLSCLGTKALSKACHATDYCWLLSSENARTFMKMQFCMWIMML